MNSHETTPVNTKISPKKYSTTMLLCFLVGPFGVHRFYVGKIWTGLLQLFTLGGLFIWVSIDMVKIITEKFEDAEGRLIKEPIINTKEEE